MGRPKINQEDKKIKFGISLDPKLYQKLKDTHARVASLFNEYFPNTPVLITFGNNDCTYHDNAPH